MGKIKKGGQEKKRGKRRGGREECKKRKEEKKGKIYREIKTGVRKEEVYSEVKMEKWNG